MSNSSTYLHTSSGTQSYYVRSPPLSSSPPFAPGSASTAVGYATDPLGRPLDLPLPSGALSPSGACNGAVQSIIHEPSALRHPDKSISMLPLVSPLLTEFRLVVCAGNAACNTDVDDDESSTAGPSDEKPLWFSVWCYKYLLP